MVPSPKLGAVAVPVVLLRVAWRDGMAGLGCGDAMTSIVSTRLPASPAASGAVAKIGSRR